MIDAAVMFGANRTRAQHEMTEVLKFEKRFVSVCVYYKKDNSFGHYMTFSNFLSQYDRNNDYSKSMIQEFQPRIANLNWTDFLSWNFHNIEHFNDNETVVFRARRAIVSLAINSMETFLSTKRTIANYLAWRLVLMSSEFLNDELHQRFFRYKATETGVRKMIPRPIECVKKTMKLYETSSKKVISEKNVFDMKI